MYKIDNYHRNLIDYLKMLSIFSVIFAHTVSVYESSSLLYAYIKLFSNFGVFTFFIISGFLYPTSLEKQNSYFFRKTRNVVFPWIFWGSIVFIISSLFGDQKQNISLFSYLNFLFGNGSYLYFMSSLTTFYLFFRINRLRFLNIYIILGTFSIILTIFGLLNINPYINPINWLLFFTIGLKFRTYPNFLESFYKLIETYKITLLTCSTVVLLVIVFFTYRDDLRTFYFSLNTLVFYIFQLSWILSIFKVSNHLLPMRFVSLYRVFARNTLLIYLTHMPVVGVLNLVFTGYPVISGLLTITIYLLVLIFINNVNFAKLKNVGLLECLGVRV